MLNRPLACDPTIVPTHNSPDHNSRRPPGPAGADPGTPAGDADEEHEDNTYGLPEGRPIRRAFKRFAKRQLRQTLSRLPEIGAPLPTSFPPLTDWTQPMAGAMTPLIGMYWDEAGQTTRARLGLDPDEWEVHDPHLHDVIRQQAFRVLPGDERDHRPGTDRRAGPAPPGICRGTGYLRRDDPRADPAGSVGFRSAQ